MSVKRIKSSPSFCGNSSPIQPMFPFLLSFHSVCVAARGRCLDRAGSYVSESVFIEALLSFNSCQSLDLFFCGYCFDSCSFWEFPGCLTWPLTPSAFQPYTFSFLMDCHGGLASCSMHERASSFSFYTQTMLYSSFLLPISLCRLICVAEL